jgi:hypothetical protein
VRSTRRMIIGSEITQSIGGGVKAKGSGQACPLYTNNAFPPPGAGPALSHARIIIVMRRTDAS